MSSLTITLIGGPTALIEIDGFRILVRDGAKAPPHHEESILAKYDRRHPAGHQRHEGCDQSVDQAILAGGGCDELLEPDLDDVERGFGSRHQLAIGKQLDLDV